ncbi:MAG: peptidoglycan DD-metalloendopeptidase family protein [Lachnospiraceae bacterium]|nr:peptidoglycan DD-metalloendopeptidase family protein [Lachnospiraceae bacterium]
MVVLCLGTVTMAKDDDKDDKNDGSKQIEALQNSISEKQGQLSDLEKEKQQIQAGRTNVQKLKESLVNSRNEINAMVEELDMEVATLQSNIESYNALIEAKKLEVQETMEEVRAAEQTVDDYYAAMKQRIRFMYESGSTSSLELLLSSNSLAEMLNKAEYIEALQAYDRQKLEEYQLVVEYCQLVKEQLEDEQAVLEEAQAALAEEQSNINELIETKTAEIQAYNDEINNTQQALNEYDEEIEAQDQIIKELEAAIKADQQALSEATRRHYDGGVFRHPCPGYKRVSSEFGNRVNPVTGRSQLHNGIDLAAAAGTPIYAAYDGTVVAASYTSAMGNYVMIDHGDGLYTIYMHASALYVSKGQGVKAGDHIAAVGTTGRSTGNHLHFTVRLNGNYINPREYFTP